MRSYLDFYVMRKHRKMSYRGREVWSDKFMPPEILRWKEPSPEGITYMWHHNMFARVEFFSVYMGRKVNKRTNVKLAAYQEGRP